MDVAKPSDEGTASYFCLLSLQTQGALVHRKVPWGLPALSGPWVPPCRALLKTWMATSELGPCAAAKGSIGSIFLVGRLCGASCLVSLLLPPSLYPTFNQEARVTLSNCRWITSHFCPKPANGFSTHMG